MQTWKPKCENCRDTGWRNIAPYPREQLVPCGCVADMGSQEPSPAAESSRERGIPVYSDNPQTQAEIEYFFDPDGDGDLD